MNIHHYSPPLWRIIVNYIYNIWLFINSVPNKYNRAEYIRPLKFCIVIILLFAQTITAITTLLHTTKLTALARPKSGAPINYSSFTEKKTL